MAKLGNPSERWVHRADKCQHHELGSEQALFFVSGRRLSVMEAYQGGLQCQGGLPYALPFHLFQPVIACEPSMETRYFHRQRMSDRVRSPQRPSRSFCPVEVYHEDLRHDAGYRLMFLAECQHDVKSRCFTSTGRTKDYRETPFSAGKADIIESFYFWIFFYQIPNLKIFRHCCHPYYWPLRSYDLPIRFYELIYRWRLTESFLLWSLISTYAQKIKNAQRTLY